MKKAKALRGALDRPAPVLVAGAHDALTSVLAERAGFGAVWASSFEISASRALPDASLLGLADYLEAAERMNAAVSVPVIADCDTGFGNSLNVAYTVQRYEAAGVAAVCLEDKVFPKLNSFSGRHQALVSPSEFQHKIETAKSVQQDPDFIVIARTEALVEGEGVPKALARAAAYVGAGADAVLVHSKAASPAEVQEFLREWNGRAPVVVVPTTYFGWTADEAAAAGASMVIYANQGLRSMVTAVDDAFRHILGTRSTAGLEGQIASVKDIFALQSFDRWMEYEP